METKINTKTLAVPTEQEWQALRPSIESAAQEKVDRLASTWTPEFRGALKKLSRK